ncbi:hypothetical protein [Phenylobacterium sp.]|jgi:hypothetical protein|uniref:hypothetical protein n=1 Tax=Phenylobacterium sp. TaxID=1871053 RepID=UPI00378379DB
MGFRPVLGRDLLAAAGLSLLSACVDQPEPAKPAPPTAARPPAPPPVLARAELLGAVAAAADAAATAGPYPAAATRLAGRRFKIRMPFGCTGPTPQAGASYAYDAEAGSLKLSVRPENWTTAPWARDLVGGETTEAINGFWLRRPWIAGDACPAGAKPTTAEGLTLAPTGLPEAESVGLAQAFEAGGSRIGRRGDRPYEVTIKTAPQTPIGAGGFRLILEGRVASPEDQRPVRCRSEHPDRRPVCLVAVTFTRIAFETPSGELLSEWGG